MLGKTSIWTLPARHTSSPGGAGNALSSFPVPAHEVPHVLSKWPEGEGLELSTECVME